jgi:DNA polymerase-1
MPVAFDIEANGFLDEVTTVHCIVITDLVTGLKSKFRPSEVELGCRLLMSSDTIVGHNIVAYDIPVIQKLFPWFHIPREKVIDTLVLSRLVYTNLSDTDTRRKAVVEAKLIGSHSLAAWGLRFKQAKIAHEEWAYFTEEMLERCSVDVDITVRLWEALEAEKIDPVASELEHEVATIVANQVRYGVVFDEAKARILTAKLMAKRVALEVQLQDTFKPFFMPGVEYEPKVNSKTEVVGYYTGVVHRIPLPCEEGEEQRYRKQREFKGYPAQKIKLTIFNPGSRHHIAYKLKQLFNWQPQEFTPTGEPKIDETVLGKLPWPEAKLLNEFFLVQKRLSMLAEGDGAWLNFVKNGRIHGGVITNGAVTGRATHSKPNLGQVPAVGALYGAECRELFTITGGRVQVGVDVSGLELRMLAHFMARFDGGAYGRLVCDGDVHWANVQALGLTDEERDEHAHPLHKLYRDGAKTFIYGFLYGAGDVKIGSIVYDIVLKAKAKGLPYQHLLDTYFEGSESPDEKVLKSCGSRLKKTFLEKTPGLKTLVSEVKKAAKRGYLFGLDGRKLHIRSDHAALNTLLQSAGGLICKRWMVEIDKELTRRNWHNVVVQILWVHDELQFECVPEYADEFSKLAVDCIPKAQEFFKIRVPLTGEAKIGNNWKECH